jgi:diguanylate cyclase (GGDEF)-like protein
VSDGRRTAWSHAVSGLDRDRSIRRGTRADDLLARLGGDEFVVADVESTVDLEELAKRIEQNASDHDVEASIGIAISPHDGDDLADVIHVAGHRMYRQKLRKQEQQERDVA